MTNLLFLYDTNEKDLARDFMDLLKELNIGSIIDIPLSPNLGYSLQDKEKHYFDQGDAALFLITPGAERLGTGSLFPSPSVTHEMGKASEKFQKKMENLFYVVDKNCNLPVIDVKAYISFDRSNIRSIVAALTQLLKDLKTASIFRVTPIPAQVVKQDKKIDLNEFSSKLPDQIKKVLFDISNKPNGIIEDSDLTNILKLNYNLTVQDINFLKNDLQSYNVVNHNITGQPYYMNLWFLNELGWSIVRLEVEKKKKAERESINFLVNFLGQNKHLGQRKSI